MIEIKEQPVNIWDGVAPCWEKCHCPEIIKSDCPAPKYQFLYCWEIEGTYCKLNDYGARGDDTSICESCRVYKKYGNNNPIQLKLFGRGINTKLDSLKNLG
jgi:hypothetical protein